MGDLHGGHLSQEVDLRRSDMLILHLYDQAYGRSADP